MRRFMVPQLVITLITIAIVSASCSGGSSEYSKSSAELKTLVDEISGEFSNMSLALDSWSSSVELADAVVAMQTASKSCSRLVEIEIAIVAKAVEAMNQADTDEQVKAAQNTVDAYSSHLDVMKSLESSLEKLSYSQNALHALSGAINAIDSSRRSVSDGSGVLTISEATTTLDGLSGPLKSGTLEEAIGAESTAAVADMTAILSSIGSSSSESKAVWADDVDDIVLDSEAALSELKAKISGLTREVMKGIESISSSSVSAIEE